MRLNLGCGRAQYPTIKENPFVRHQLYALEHIPAAFNPDAEWINADRAAIDGVQEVLNLWCYPWLRSSNGQPFADNSIDEIYCGHIVEHIPHRAEFNVFADKTVKKAGDLDGWYAFMYECWRILEPGGILHVVAPHAYGDGALSDPSHTRCVLPYTFGYFTPNPDAPFDYELPCVYKQTGTLLLAFTTAGQELVHRFGMDIALRLGAASEFYIQLEAVK